LNTQIPIYASFLQRESAGRGAAREEICEEDHSRLNHDGDYDYCDGGDCNFGKKYGQKQKVRALDRYWLGSLATFFDKTTPMRSSCTRELTIRFICCHKMAA
jgi:hypothetical protein